MLTAVVITDRQLGSEADLEW